MCGISQRISFNNNEAPTKTVTIFLVREGLRTCFNPAYYPNAWRWLCECIMIPKESKKKKKKKNIVIDLSFFKLYGTMLRVTHVF